jgi:predicted nuclease of predicted toxin-antitoxin system
VKIVADENIPRLGVERLRVAGHDVVYIADEHSGALDPAVLQRAGSDARVLITEDRDFGTLVYAQFESPPSGVVYLRLGTARPEAVADALVKIFEHPAVEIVGHLTVVEPGRTRQRPLPKR